MDEEEALRVNGTVDVLEAPLNRGKADDDAGSRTDGCGEG